MKRAGIVEGAFIGKYELRREIGRGPMSAVYEATDRALHRTVAIKFLLIDSLDERKYITRFQQEAKALGTLEHPNIVKVHETDVTADGVPFIVMNYLGEYNLAKLIADGTILSSKEWLQFMIQSCSALEHAHAHGIIHRDIKPSNFVISQENDTQVIKLIDFGIAKNTLEEIALTRTGDVFGSPLYMSPEQCCGAKLDERSDVYSLGCVMYETLSGKPPCVGDNTLSTMQKHIKASPEPLSALNKSMTSQDLQGIEQVVMKCLQKRPEDRYQKISDLKNDLTILSEGKKLAVNRSPLGGIGKTYGIKPTHAIGISIAAVALILSGISVWQYSNTKSTGSKQQTDRVTAPAKIFKPDFSEIDRSEIDDDKTEKHFREVKKEIRTQMQKQNFNEALALSKQALELANQLKKPPDVVAAMQWRVGQAYYRMENYPAAAREFKATLKTVANQNDVDSLRCKFQALMGCGRVAYYNRELANASMYFNAAYNSIEARKQDPQLPQAEKDAVVKHKSVCMFYLGEVNEEMNNFEKAVKYYKASLQFNPDNSRARERLRASQLKLGGLSAPNVQLEKVSPRSDDSEI